ncbi:unnamed protein product [Oikopleura dioica]|uniref:PDZ domain-containing protein n=1 Tax=Oikopleura dioica TaxID=34765 RepID=E4XJ90_OIKDI|nr:unnamed protein product [Oikopleura dioica]
MARAVFLDKGDGYGFHLASEKGVQFIRRIVEDSPAQNAGMLEGDRLLGVNDENIIGQNHSEVVEIIRKGGSSCRLVVISPAPTLDLTDDSQMMLQMPRECVLARKDKGFGFVLHSERKQKTSTTFYMTKLQETGASWEAGVNDDDRIVSIDGELITSDLEHAEVVQKIKDKKVIKVVVVSRHNMLDLSLCQALRVPALRRVVYEEQSAPVTSVPEISARSSSTTSSAQVHENSTDTSTTAPSAEHLPSSRSSSEKTEEVDENGNFRDIDFTKMSLSELRSTIRLGKKRQTRDMSWAQQRSVFKDL